jgi:hypothetical protein
MNLLIKENIMTDVKIAEAGEVTKQTALIGGFLAIVAVSIVSCTAYTFNPNSMSAMLEKCEYSFKATDSLGKTILPSEEFIKNLYEKREKCVSEVLESVYSK